MVKHLESPVFPDFRSRRVLAAIFLLLSFGASFMLCLQHVVGLSLPGCGPASGCASLAEGPWGNIFGWPVSFAGATYFFALIMVWPWLGEAGVPMLFKWLVRLGVLGSLVFVAVMFFEQHFCLYCALTHAGNLCFWIVVETCPTAAATPWRAMGGWAAAVVLGTSVFGIAEWQVRAQADAVAHQQADESIAQITATTTSTERVGDDQGPGFTGRYRLGPEKAMIRFVVFTDYQCKDCSELELRLKPLMESRSDISLSMKHFPLCGDCNPMVKFPHFHDNACRMAQAAEAAGLLAGGEAFWRLNNWLFEHRHEYSDEELVAALPQLGFAGADQIAQFLATMSSNEVRQLIDQDVEEGMELGIDGTPVIYINGVELRGWDAEDTLDRAIAALDQAKPPARTAAADHPAGQIERRTAIWQEIAVEEKLPVEPGRWSLGPADAPVRVVLFFDYRNPYSPQLWQNLEAVCRENTEVRLDLYQFPISKVLNPRFDKLAEERYPLAADAVQMVEAAGLLGGEQAFWRMHRWVLENRETFSRQAASDAAAKEGLDAEALSAAADSPEVAQAIAADLEKALPAEVSFAPRLYIAGRKVSTASPSRELLRRLLELAGKK
ncbi:DsbA family protein [Lignipirellula cremea]|uniref:DSBA-like thioredoxin domain protein n=1 Tax=Lignipirellula cremea TaxID=2528010 RepID=A0A518DRP4_9BACT|nr:DsbA family protein [Lignipirellula cremea]QDU94493.1 DSBA-like thioredoxin domain protein [Lignipirellula cremea]